MFPLAFAAAFWSSSYDFDVDLSLECLDNGHWVLLLAVCKAEVGYHAQGVLGK